MTEQVTIAELDIDNSGSVPTVHYRSSCNGRPIDEPFSGTLEEWWFDDTDNQYIPFVASTS